MTDLCFDEPNRVATELSSDDKLITLNEEDKVIDLLQKKPTCTIVDNCKTIDIPNNNLNFSQNSEVLICEGCQKKSPRNVKRLCTGGTILCRECRQSPQYKIITSYTLKRRFPNFPKKYWPLPVGKLRNSFNYRYKPFTVYRWSDVIMICMNMNLSIPEYFFS